MLQPLWSVKMRASTPAKECARPKSILLFVAPVLLMIMKHAAGRARAGWRGAKNIRQGQKGWVLSLLV